jgi:hypothetical protein
LRPSQTSVWSPRTAGSRGRLRISAPLLFGHVAMGRIAARFTEAYPEARLEIIVEDRYVDLVEEGETVTDLIPELAMGASKAWKRSSAHRASMLGVAPQLTRVC